MRNTQPKTASQKRDSIESPLVSGSIASLKPKKKAKVVHKRENPRRVAVEKVLDKQWRMLSKQINTHLNSTLLRQVSESREWKRGIEVRKYTKMKRNVSKWQHNNENDRAKAKWQPPSKPKKVEPWVKSVDRSNELVSLKRVQKRVHPVIREEWSDDPSSWAQNSSDRTKCSVSESGITLPMPGK